MLVDKKTKERIDLLVLTRWDGDEVNILPIVHLFEPKRLVCTGEALEKSYDCTNTPLS